MPYYERYLFYFVCRPHFQMFSPHKSIGIDFWKKHGMPFAIPRMPLFGHTFIWYTFVFALFWYTLTSLVVEWWPNLDQVICLLMLFSLPWIASPGNCVFHAVISRDVQQIPRVTSRLWVLSPDGEGLVGNWPSSEMEASKQPFPASGSLLPHLSPWHSINPPLEISILT